MIIKLNFKSNENVELTDTDAEQAWIYIKPKINQKNKIGVKHDNKTQSCV